MSKINYSIPTEKSFGILFSILFLVIALYPLYDSQAPHLWLIIVSTIFLLLAFLSPRLLSIPNKLWFKMGIFLSSIISPIVITLIYLVSIVPTGLIMRFLGKDLLKQKLDKNAKSYWVKRSEPMGSMKNQF